MTNELHQTTNPVEAALDAMRYQIERLIRIEAAARAYYLGYCQDEADDPMLCISDKHHAAAQELRDALGEPELAAND